MNSQTREPVITRFSSGVREALGNRIVAIHWFGSRSRGGGTDDSDYDLLLETKTALTERERDKIADIAVDVSADYGVLLDIHHRTVDQMHQAPFACSPFIQSVMREGVLV